MKSSLPVDVFDSLQQILRLFRTCIRQALESVHPELTFNEMRMLMHTGENPGVTQKELVEHSRIDKAQMARTLARLQDHGWLERSPSQNDKRVRCLHLSPAGWEIFAKLRELRARVAQQLLRDCPPDAQAQLLVLLKQACGSAHGNAAALDVTTDEACV